MAQVGIGTRWRLRRWMSRCFTTLASSTFRCVMRSRTVRRSFSSWVSPSPPIAPLPRWRERCVQARVRRGREYSMRASATWSMASRVWARSAKISRMTSCRSMTARPDNSSQLRCCAGERASSNTMTSTPSAFARSTNSWALPLPRSSEGVGRRRFTRVERSTLIRRFSTNSLSSSRSSAPSPSAMPSFWTPTRKARSSFEGLSVRKSAMRGLMKAITPCRVVKRGGGGG